MLGRELSEAGLRPMPVEPPESPDPPEPLMVRDPGRHSRGAPDRDGSRTARWLEGRLPAALQGRLALRAAHLVVLSVVLATAVVVAAWATLRTAPDQVPIPVAHTSSPVAPTAADDADDAGAAEPAGGAAVATATEVIVDVAGKVRRPGVLTLPTGSRVIDALRRAGGARPGVDLSALNLARVLIDGEQVLVGRAGPALAGGAVSGGPDAVGAAVSLNTASLEQLESLPGVGPVTAQKILDWRTEHGAFGSVDELLDVDGIGAKTLADLSPHVTL
jgi:competence protein ComEA